MKNSLCKHSVAKMSTIAVIGTLMTAVIAYSYPPGVGFTSKSRNCIECHADNGLWRDDAHLIIELLDAQSKTSLRQSDGTFLLQIPRGQTRRVLTVLGRAGADTLPPPIRNGWAYVDTSQIALDNFSKFTPGWDVDLPMSCRAVGDTLSVCAGDHVTIVPLAVRPGDDAKDGEVQLQVLLTSGTPVKGKPKEGLLSSYFMRRVRLDVTD